jgi:predicted nucleic acid-binding protein
LKTIVVDASVAIKWFIPEIHSLAAARLLELNLQLLVPDLIFAEVGNILWKKLRLKELIFDNATAILNDFKKLPFNSYDSESLLNAAWIIAAKYHCALYDSLYVALAQAERTLLVTADSRLYNALKSTSLAKNLLWVEDIKKI